MDEFKIIEIDSVKFDEYKKWFNKYKENNDKQEIKYQNEVVKKFISAICPDFDVENTEKKGPPTCNHDYLQYCGTYIDRNGKEKPTTPDLVIAKNWNWLNKVNDVDYRAVVEVKSPYLQPIYNKGYKEYGVGLKKEMRRHLSATHNDKVILTDALKWEFYNKENKLDPIRTFKLYDLFEVMGEWEWKKGEQVTVEDDVTKEVFGHILGFEAPVEEFEDLKDFLEEFLEKTTNSNL